MPGGQFGGQGLQVAAKANLTWIAPGRGSQDSMPLGNGDIGLNVWTEPKGDLAFYIIKTDSVDENVRLLKLGRVRVTLSPNPFVDLKSFRQELQVDKGVIVVTGGGGDGAATLRGQASNERIRNAFVKGDVPGNIHNPVLVKQGNARINDPGFVAAALNLAVKPDSGIYKKRFPISSPSRSIKSARKSTRFAR